MLHDVFDDVTARFQVGTDSDHTELFNSVLLILKVLTKQEKM